MDIDWPRGYSRVDRTGMVVEFAGKLAHESCVLIKLAWRAAVPAPKQVNWAFVAFAMSHQRLCWFGQTLVEKNKSLRSGRMPMPLTRRAVKTLVQFIAYTMDSYVPSTVPGCRTPHPWCADGRSLYDAMGPEFTPLRFDRAVDVTPLELAAESRGVPLRVLDLPHQQAAAFHDGGLVLSCPDRHVAWRGDALPADSLALIDYVRGASREYEALTGRATSRAESLLRFDRVETGLQIPDLTRFPDANRFPLRLKTL
jgi:hypothetical protein